MNLELVKKVALFLSFFVWAILIYKIFKSGGTMDEQLPKCIFTTIIVFAILNIFVKVLEHISKNKEDS